MLLQMEFYIQIIWRCMSLNALRSKLWVTMWRLSHIHMANSVFCPDISVQLPVYMWFKLGHQTLQAYGVIHTRIYIFWSHMRLEKDSSMTVLRKTSRSRMCPLPPAGGDSVYIKVLKIKSLIIWLKWNQKLLSRSWDYSKMSL